MCIRTGDPHRLHFDTKTAIISAEVAAPRKNILRSFSSLITGGERGSSSAGSPRPSAGTAGSIGAFWADVSSAHDGEELY